MIFACECTRESEFVESLQFKICGTSACIAVLQAYCRGYGMYASSVRVLCFNEQIIIRWKSSAVVLFHNNQKPYLISGDSHHDTQKLFLVPIIFIVILLCIRLFLCLGAFTHERQLSFMMFVCLSTVNSSVFAGPIFIKFQFGDFY